MKLDLMKLFSRTTVRSVVIVLTIIFNFGFLSLLTFKEVPKENKDLINILGGAIVVTSVGAVFGYLFGQSKTSDKKPDISQ